jgi:hypothetical protein
VRNDGARDVVQKPCLVHAKVSVGKVGRWLVGGFPIMSSYLWKVPPPSVVGGGTPCLTDRPRDRTGNFNLKRQIVAAGM